MLHNHSGDYRQGQYLPKTHCCHWIPICGKGCMLILPNHQPRHTQPLLGTSNFFVVNNHKALRPGGGGRHQRVCTSATLGRLRSFHLEDRPN